MGPRVVDRPWYHLSSTAGDPDTLSTLWGPILARNPRNRRVWLATDERFHWWCWWLVPCSYSCSCLVWLVCDSLDHWSSWPLVPRDADSLVFLSSDSLGGTLQDGDSRPVLFNYHRPLIYVVSFLLSLAPCYILTITLDYSLGWGLNLWPKNYIGIQRAPILNSILITLEYVKGWGLIFLTQTLHWYPKGPHFESCSDYIGRCP